MLALAGPQEFFKQHLIKNEEHPFFWKIYSAHFGEVSTLIKLSFSKTNLSKIQIAKDS